jgi:hypothetical protein
MSRHARPRFALAVLATLALVGCNFYENTDSREQVQVHTQQDQYARTQPVPYFEWSLQRDLYSEIYKLKNEAVATWSYVWDQYRGKISFECASVGFPIPGGTELTNPYQVTYGQNGGSGVVSQAEPDGLFAPDVSEGTYVLCTNDDGSVSPVYLEERVRAYFQPMQEVGGKLVPVPKRTPSAMIAVKTPEAGETPTPER